MSDDTTKDHPDQVVDTPVPDGEYVNEAAWEAMRDAALNGETDAPDDSENADG